MISFIEKLKDKINGILSGFDRLVIKGIIKPLSYTAGMMNFLYEKNILLKDFGNYVETTSKMIKQSSLKIAEKQNRPVQYLASSQIKKETLAQEIALKAGIVKGLVCILTCVEPCKSYYIRKDRESKQLVLEPKVRKCLYIYHYWIDPVFGFMNARIQTWFPFDIYICLNGREWLSKQLDRKKISYTRYDNCYFQIENIETAQRLMKQQLLTNWKVKFTKIANTLNPVFKKITGDYPLEYYWTTHQSEWATDIMFRSSKDLAAIYPALVKGSIEIFGCHDVMRFLGKKYHGNFKGEVVSDYKERPEGIRIKHRLGANSVKMYDKGGRVLRIETTINDPKGFKVYRPKQGNEEAGKCEWNPLRKSVADIKRLAHVSQASNNRYLEAISSLGMDMPIIRLIEGVCKPASLNGERMRALRPWSEEDSLLLKAVSKGEYAVNGFRNKDIRSIIFPEYIDEKEKKRQAGRITRRFRLLRAHGLIRKVKNTHRYVLTKKGRRIISAIIESQNLTLKQLNSKVA
jgi:hypothetical protein